MYTTTVCTGTQYHVGLGDMEKNIFTIILFLSVDMLLSRRVAHLMQLPQENLSKVKRREADPHCNRPLHPVHAETFVESTDEPLLRHDLLHGAQDGAICVTGDSGSLHAPSYHIQRVRRRLADETRAGSKRQALVRVGVWAAAAFYTGEEVVKECRSAFVKIHICNINIQAAFRHRIIS